VWHYLTYAYYSVRLREWVVIMQWVHDATKLTYRRASNAFMRTNGGYTPEQRADPNFRSLLDCGPLEYYLELHEARLRDAAEHDRAVEPLSPQCGHLPITVEVMKYVQRSAHPDHHFPPQPHWLPQPTVAEQAKMIEIVSGELLADQPPSQLYASIDLSLALRHYQNHCAHRRACVAKWQTPELTAVFTQWTDLKATEMIDNNFCDDQVDEWNLSTRLSPELVFRSQMLWNIGYIDAWRMDFSFESAPVGHMQQSFDWRAGLPYHGCPRDEAQAPAAAPSQTAGDLPDYRAELAAASRLDSSLDFKVHLESTGCSCGFGDLTCTTDACVKPPTVARSGSDGDSAAAAAMPPVMQSPTATAVYLNALRRRMIRDKHLKLSRLKQPQSADGHSEAELQRHAAAVASMKNEDLWLIGPDNDGGFTRSVQSMVERLPPFAHPLAAGSVLLRRSPALSLLLAAATRGRLGRHRRPLGRGIRGSAKRSRAVEPTRPSGAASQSPVAKKSRSTVPAARLSRAAPQTPMAKYRDVPSAALRAEFSSTAEMNEVQLTWRALVQKEMRSPAHLHIYSTHERCRMAMRFWMDKCLIPYFESKGVLPMYAWRTLGGLVFAQRTEEEEVADAAVYTDLSVEVVGLTGTFAKKDLMKNEFIKSVAGFVLSDEVLRLCPIGHFTAIALKGAKTPHVLVADPTDAVAQINHDQPFSKTSAKFCTDVSKMSQPRMSSCRRFVAESGVVQSDFYRARTLKAVPRGKELTIYYGTDADFWDNLSLTCEHCALKDSPNESSTLVDPVLRCDDAACRTGWHADCYQQRHHQAIPRRWTCRMHAEKKAAAADINSPATSAGSGVGYSGAPDTYGRAAPAAPAAAAPRRSPDFVCNGRRLYLGENLTEMRDSTAAYLAGDFATLRATLAVDGYLFVRGVIPPAHVAEARSRVLQQMRNIGCIPPTAPVGSAIPTRDSQLRVGCTVDLTSGESVGYRATPAADAEKWQAVGQCAAVAAITSGPEIQSFFCGLRDAGPAVASSAAAAAGCGRPCSPIDSTLVRFKNQGESTPAHVDFLYYYKNTDAVVKYCQRPQPSGSASASASSSSAAVHSCAECQRASPRAELLCSLCGLSFHSACQQPSNRVSPGAGWACSSCVNAHAPLWTVWTPLQQISGKATSRLVVIPGSHLLGGYEAPRSNSRLPRDASPLYLTNSLYAIPLTIGMGDFVLINSKLVHCATAHNQLEIDSEVDRNWRISMDFRIFGWLVDDLQPYTVSHEGVAASVAAAAQDPSQYSLPAAPPRHPNLLAPVDAILTSNLAQAHIDINLPADLTAVYPFVSGSRIGEPVRLGLVSRVALVKKQWVTFYADHLCLSSDAAMQAHGAGRTMPAGWSSNSGNTHVCLVYDAAPIVNMYRNVVCHTQLALSQVEYLDPALLLPLASEYSAADFARFHSAPKGGMVCSVEGRVGANGRPLEPNVKWVRLSRAVDVKVGSIKSKCDMLVLEATRDIVLGEELLVRSLRRTPTNRPLKVGTPNADILQVGTPEQNAADDSPAAAAAASSSSPVSSPAASDSDRMHHQLVAMLLQYLHFSETSDFRFDLLKSGDIVNQKFLLDAMPLPAGAPLELVALVNRMVEDLHAALYEGPVLRPAYTGSHEWMERIAAFSSPPSAAAASSAPPSYPHTFGFIPLLSALQTGFTIRLAGGKSEGWKIGGDVLSCHEVAKAIEQLTSTVVHDWLVARAAGPDRERLFIAELYRFDDFFRALEPAHDLAGFWTRPANTSITGSLMYLGTHVIFVQSDYSSSAPRSGALVASHSVCTYLERNLEVPRRQHNAELLAECVAVFFEEPSFRHLCIPLWRSGVAEPHRVPQLPAHGTVGYTLSKQIHHFIITLLHIYLCMHRALGSAQPSPPSYHTACS
jgi:hypothetical protein